MTSEVLTLANNEYVNSLGVYTLLSQVGVNDDIPAFLLTTNLGNTLACGEASDTLKTDLLTSQSQVTYPALTYIADTIFDLTKTHQAKA